MFDKKRLLILAILFLFIFNIVSLQAQIPDTETLENDSIIKGVNDLREFTEEQEWEFIGQKWKERFLANKAISGIDSFFRKINVIFVVLFGRNYDLSVELLFAAVLWMATFLSMPKYLSFLREEWMRYAGGLAIVVALANAQFFNFVSSGLFGLLFFKFEWYWSAISVLLLVAALAIYLIILKYFGQIIKKNSEKKKQVEAKKNEAKIEGIAKGIDNYGKGE